MSCSLLVDETSSRNLNNLSIHHLFFSLDSPDTCQRHFDNDLNDFCHTPENVRRDRGVTVNTPEKYNTPSEDEFF